MSEKQWTYSEITAKAESEIRSHMEQGDIMRKIFARGTYLLWSNLTMGWQQDGDDQRLRQLIDGKGKGK